MYQLRLNVPYAYVIYICILCIGIPAAPVAKTTSDAMEGGRGEGGGVKVCEALEEEVTHNIVAKLPCGIVRVCLRDCAGVRVIVRVCA